jgi:hypothetical protein
MYEQVIDGVFTPRGVVKAEALNAVESPMFVLPPTGFCVPTLLIVVNWKD